MIEQEERRVVNLPNMMNTIFRSFNGNTVKHLKQKRLLVGILSISILKTIIDASR